MTSTPIPQQELAAPRWAWLPRPGTWKYYALLGAVGILVLGPLGGLAASYMKKAGYSSGKCSGNACTITIVGDNTPPGSNTAQLIKSQLTALGFNVQLHPVEHATMITKFCSVVANDPNVCPNVGWVKDFNDGQAMIDVPFNGATITASPTNNANQALLNNPAINAALNSAKYITDPTQRAAAYGRPQAVSPALVSQVQGRPGPSRAVSA